MIKLTMLSHPCIGKEQWQVFVHPEMLLLKIQMRRRVMLTKKSKMKRMKMVRKKIRSPMSVREQIKQ